MTLIEFLEKVGNENLRVQTIHQSLVGYKQTKHDVEITFASEKSNTPSDNSNRVGIVVWMDADKYSEATNENPH